MRHSKRIDNSAGAAAQPCLMQNYHKALVLFSKAQQLDFLFCAFFSLLVREPMPTTESVVGCKLFMKNLPKRTIKPKGVFKESFDLHTRSFFNGLFFFILNSLTLVAIKTVVPNFKVDIMCANVPNNNTKR